MAELSPAAQAVLEAYGEQVGGSAAITGYERRGIAAALRAAADQAPIPVSVDDLPEQNARWYRLGVVNFRQKLRAIATELEGTP